MGLAEERERPKEERRARKREPEGCRKDLTKRVRRGHAGGDL